MKLQSSFHRRRALYACAVAAVLAVAIRPARATTIAETDLAALARGADAVVHAVVERTGTQMAYNASVAPFSVAQLRVLRWLAGGAAERIWIRDPGAVWANGGRPVIGAAVYSPGEEVIVFLRKDAGGYFRTHNLAAGKLLVRRDGAQPVVEQNLEEVSVLVESKQKALAEPASSASAIARGQRKVLAPLSDVLSQLQVLLGASP
jgi:hypothetical protein